MVARARDTYSIIVRDAYVPVGPYGVTVTRPARFRIVRLHVYGAIPSHLANLAVDTSCVLLKRDEV